MCHAPMMLTWMTFKFIAQPKSDLEVRNIHVHVADTFGEEGVGA